MCCFICPFTNRLQLFLCFLPAIDFLLIPSHIGDGSLNASLSQNAAAYASNNYKSGDDNLRMSTTSKDQYLTQQKTSVPILSKQQKMQRSASGDSDQELANRLIT